MKTRWTQKQETFCLKYFELGNATEAAKIAGYSPKTVAVIASENLTKPKIIDRLQELRQATENASVASVLERKQRLTKISRANLIDFVDPDGNITLEAENNGALQEVTVSELRSGQKEPITTRNTKVKLHNPISAIAELNKMEKIYSENSFNILNVNVNARNLTDEQLAIIAEGDNPISSRKRITQEAEGS